MQQKFVCVLSKEDNINTQLKNIQIQFETIVEEWEKGENRNYLKI